MHERGSCLTPNMIFKQSNPSHLRPAPKIIEVKGKFFPLGWIKVYTNGATIGAHDHASTRGIFRDHDGEVKAIEIAKERN
jgi:hypothetical protein